MIAATNPVAPAEVDRNVRLDPGPVGSTQRSISLPSPPQIDETPPIDPLNESAIQRPEARGGSVRGFDSNPIVISKVDPDYSLEARAAGYSGTVLLSALIDEDGIPTDIRVLQPLGYGLTEKAIEALQKWRFKPGMKNGRPVRVRATCSFVFNTK